MCYKADTGDKASVRLSGRPAIAFPMANERTYGHLDQEPLCNKDDESILETLADWLSKESTAFGKPKDGKKKCVDSRVVQVVQPLFQHMALFKKVRFAIFSIRSQLTLSSLLNLYTCYIESRVLTPAEFTAPPRAHVSFRFKFWMEHQRFLTLQTQRYKRIWLLGRSLISLN